MKTTRRAMLKLIAAVATGLSVLTTKANKIRQQVVDEEFNDTTRFWDWWDKNVKGHESVNVTILGRAKSGKTTLAAQIYARQTGIRPEAISNGVAHTVWRAHPVRGSLNAIMFEDGGPLGDLDRSHYLRPHKGCRVNVRHVDMRDDAEWLVVPATRWLDEIAISDIVLLTYRLPGSDKFRVRVTKNRWGTTDDQVFCL